MILLSQKSTLKLMKIKFSCHRNDIIRYHMPVQKNTETFVSIQQFFNFNSIKNYEKNSLFMSLMLIITSFTSCKTFNYMKKIFQS